MWDNTIQKPNSLNDIKILRNELRKKLRDKTRLLDPEAPETLTFATASLLETHFEPKAIADLVGTSRTSIARWAEGQNVPRSAGYRKWVVETLLTHVENAIE